MTLRQIFTFSQLFKLILSEMRLPNLSKHGERLTLWRYKTVHSSNLIAKHSKVLILLLLSCRFAGLKLQIQSIDMR